MRVTDKAGGKSLLEVRIGTAAACAQLLFGAAFLSMAVHLGGAPASSFPIQAVIWLLTAIGAILILVSLRHALGWPVLVLDETGMHKFGVGTVHWSDVRSMRLATQWHWTGRHRDSHRVLEVQLLPGRKLHDRPPYLRWLPSPATVNFVVEGLEFEPERILSVARSLLDGLSWHHALDYDDFHSWQRGADELVEEARVVLEGKQVLGPDDYAHLARVGEDLNVLDASSRVEAELDLLARRRELRPRRLLALFVTALAALAIVAWASI